MLSRLLDDLGLQPSQLTPPTDLEPDQSYNMITQYNLVDFEQTPKQAAQSIAWCPPLPNWNPWTACNIDEGPLAQMQLKQISDQLSEEYFGRLKNEPQLRALIQDRSQLPVYPYRREILDAISTNQVTLIRGETGCGKTTQIPQFILDSFLESGLGAHCSVLVTQPRRISAISLAERVAHERGELVGHSVGYSVRFETMHPRPFGSILFCTVGTLARKMESGLRGVSHVIVDEIHERDVNSDFMLILLRDMLRTHKTLRIVLMSATIDTTVFVNYFGECAVFDVEGRTHPVKYYFLEDCIKMLNYTPPPCDERTRKRRQEASNSVENLEENCHLRCGPEYGDAVARSLREITEKEVPFDLIGALLEHIASMAIPGAVLVFLPGWNVISLLRKYLQSHPRFGSTAYLILPLHSQVPREDQRLVFRPAPPGVTKIVLSTNIAETSITINDVVFVIDSCLVRMKQFTSRNNLTSYSTSWASRTNLEQRRGRAGRVRPGYAFHLCSLARFERLEQHSTPEILRTPLHELALMIKLLRLGSVGEFLKKALQPPPLDAVIEAEHTLKDMKALDQNDELTALGRIVARLPIEPRLGKMMVFACVFRLGCAAALMAASTSLGCDPFLVLPDQHRLSEAQRRFAAELHSDHLAGLNVFQVWAAERARRGDVAADDLCERKGLNGPALRVMEDAGNQIRMILINQLFPEETLSDAAIDFNTSTRNPDCAMLCSLLTLGLYPNVAFHHGKRRLLTAEGTVALTHKSSVNCSNTPLHFQHPFFIFDEKIRTQAVSCKCTSMVNAIQLMLFGCRTATWQSGGHLLLDDWIPLRVPFPTAARLFALRPALEALLVRACLRPEHLSELESADQRLVDLVRRLSSVEAFGSSQASLPTEEEGDYAPPRKRFAADCRHPLLSGRNRKVAEFVDRGFERYVNHPERMLGPYAYQGPVYSYPRSMRQQEYYRPPGYGYGDPRPMRPPSIPWGQMEPPYEEEPYAGAYGETTAPQVESQYSAAAANWNRRPA